MCEVISMNRTIREQLIDLAEEEYRLFSSALIPTIDNVLGVRLPELRKLAKQIAREDWRSYLRQADDDYFEEIMLQGMVIGYAKADIEEILRYVSDFVPKIDNWSVCDSFCTGLKFTKANRARVLAFLQPYLVSDREYEIRFGVVMLLNFYIEEDSVTQVLQRLDSIRHEGYYVKMAVAWAVSICYVKFPEAGLAYLNDNSLDDVTYGKALQKITSSHRVDQATREMIRGLRRK
jgi:3-methyladenine DNA glycosylase AlkD